VAGIASINNMDMMYFMMISLKVDFDNRRAGDFFCNQLF